MKITLLWLTGFFIIMTPISCVQVDLIDKPNNKVNIKLPPLATDASESYTVEINGEKLLLTTEGHLPELFPGIYPLLAYSNTSSIYVLDGIAQVNEVNGQLNNFPDWFYSTFTSLNLESNSFDNNVIALEQQVRLLEMTIIPPSGGIYNRVSAIEGKLTGVAGKWDLKNNIAVGPAMEVPVHFVNQNDGTWLARLRLLGIFGNKQELIANIQFSNGSVQRVLHASNFQANQGGQSLVIVSDLSDTFQNFNIDKNVPFILSGDIELPTESGFIVSVNDWQRIYETGVAW